MANGVSLHIGLNSVDPDHYQGWSGELNACEADARDIQAIAKESGFTTRTLLTHRACRENVIHEVSRVASELNAGDIFLLSYSGHGGQLPDWSGDERDQQDETWCLYDGQLVDDETYQLLGKFRKGVRIVVLSDSCHSGTAVKAAYYYGRPAVADHDNAAEGGVRYRAMPSDVALRVYRANRDFYDVVLREASTEDEPHAPAASVLLISGCQDNQLSRDGVFNGLFTGTLLRVWGDGSFEGGYRDFTREIVRRMPPDQTPNYFTVGHGTGVFDDMRPFSI